MARPAPDEDAVVAVFEAKHFGGLSATRLAEWTSGARVEGMDREWAWDPIGRSTAHRWYQQGLRWWQEHMRLSPDEEYAQLRIGLEYVAMEVVREYRAGRLDVKTFTELSLKTSAEIRALTGAGRAVVDVDEGASMPNERAQAAIIRMLERQRERGGRKRIG